MHDIKNIRNNPEAFTAALARRGVEANVDDILRRDAAIREAKTNLQTTASQLNLLSRDIGAAMKARDQSTADSLRAQVATMKDTVRDTETRIPMMEDALQKLLLMLPNVVEDDVPAGRDDRDNVPILEHNGPDNPDAVPHYDTNLGLDFEAGALLSGSRFTVLRGEAARMHRRLGQMMLDAAIDAGFEEVIPPLLVHSRAMIGTGQLPKFEHDAFRVDDHWLIPTAEVSLTNLVADRIIDLAEPVRMTALTQCFRREAGSAGRDTRGLIRQHQFEKVEVVTVCRPEVAHREHARIVDLAESNLSRLGLRFRRVLLCAGDTGFSARKTYDLEVWMQGSKEWREISSCSTFGDFQSRRMNTRYRGEDGKTAYPTTLNGSALAVGRTLAATIEQYWDGEKVCWPI